MKFFQNPKHRFWSAYALLVVMSLLFGSQLYTLGLLPENIQSPVFWIMGLAAVVIGLGYLEFSYIRKVAVSALTLSLCLSAVYGLGTYYVVKTSGMLSAVTAVRKKNTNKVSLLVLNESDINSVDNLEGRTIGILKNIDTAGTKRLLEKIGEETSVQFEKVDLDSVPQEAMELYNGTVDAVILNEAYRANVTDLESYNDFTDRTRVITSVTFETDSVNEPLAVSDVTAKPYNILISGNDTYGDVGELSRSDVNMVVTVDPLTSTVLLTSIPRDSYVAVRCGDAYACAEGQYDKITHTGLNGITSTKQTVEQLLGIDINYTFRVNFSSVTNIVDSLGGIDIDVPVGQAVDTFYTDSTLQGVAEGINHLDGARALAFARERYAYVDGDNQRVRNQQMVLKAIFAKATSPDIVVNYPKLLEALASTFDTTLTSDEITTFIKYQIQSIPDWKFESYQIAGEGADLFCPALGQNAYVTVVDPYTVTLAHDKIMAVLNGQDADAVTEPVSPIRDDLYIQVPVYDYEYDPEENIEESPDWEESPKEADGENVD